MCFQAPWISLCKQSLTEVRGFMVRNVCHIRLVYCSPGQDHSPAHPSVIACGVHIAVRPETTRARETMFQPNPQSTAIGAGLAGPCWVHEHHRYAQSCRLVSSLAMLGSLGVVPPRLRMDKAGCRYLTAGRPEIPAPEALVQHGEANQELACRRALANLRCLGQHGREGMPTNKWKCSGRTSLEISGHPRCPNTVQQPAAVSATCPGRTAC